MKSNIPKVPCPKCESLSTSLIDANEYCCLMCLHEWKTSDKPLTPIPADEAPDTSAIHTPESFDTEVPITVSKRITVALYATKCAQCGIGNCTRRCLLSDLALEFGMTLEIIDCDMKQR